MLPCPLQMSLDWTKLTNPPFFRIPCPSHWWKNVASNHGTTIPLASPQGLATSEMAFIGSAPAMGNPWCLQDFQATLMLSSWYRGDRFVGDSGEHMEVEVKSGTMIDVKMMFQHIWNTGCGDAWVIMLKTFDHQEQLGWPCWSCSLRRSLDSTADMTVRGIAWCWAVGEWAVRRWNHRGGPFQLVPKKRHFVREKFRRSSTSCNCTVTCIKSHRCVCMRLYLFLPVLADPLDLPVVRVPVGS